MNFTVTENNSSK